VLAYLLVNRLLTNGRHLDSCHCDYITTALLSRAGCAYVYSGDPVHPWMESGSIGIGLHYKPSVFIWFSLILCGAGALYITRWLVLACWRLMFISWSKETGRD
jgi:hypothetical protein